MEAAEFIKTIHKHNKISPDGLKHRLLANKLHSVELVSQNYPFPYSIPSKGSLRETLFLADGCLKKNNKQLKNVAKEKSVKAKIIRQAIEFEEKYLLPNKDFHSQYYCLVPDGSYSFLFEEIDRPSFLLIDYGAIDCCKSNLARCNDKHQRAVVFFENLIYFIFYRPYRVFIELKPEILKNEEYLTEIFANCYDNMPSQDHVNTYEHEEAFGNGCKIVQDNSYLSNHTGWADLFKKRWPNYTKLHKKNTFMMRFIKMPRAFNHLKQKYREALKEYPLLNHYEPDSLYYSSGETRDLGYGRTEITPRFICVYYGEFKCGLECKTRHGKYLLVSEGKPNLLIDRKIKKDQAEEEFSNLESCYFFPFYDRIKRSKQKRKRKRRRR